MFMLFEQLTYWDDIPDKTIDWLNNEYGNKKIERVLTEAVKNVLL
jgi:hypothetical protein